MSTILNLGTLLAGIGGITAGAMAVLQFTSPGKIETPDDLIAALNDIERAIQGVSLTTDKATA